MMNCSRSYSVFKFESGARSFPSRICSASRDGCRNRTSLRSEKPILRNVSERRFGVVSATVAKGPFYTDGVCVAFIGEKRCQRRVTHSAIICLGLYRKHSPDQKAISGLPAFPSYPIPAHRNPGLKSLRTLHGGPFTPSYIDPVNSRTTRSSRRNSQ
jgi:hypothetical protein